ncbi:hypothetical protein [Burkholderia contaminans]|uniref:hypothetical protein n=1 Tax=Burkholderia contaminans TaxID=488447 RepID=UPI00114CCA33|nr:hypothetical protein [Burkholderia contaminans]
MDEFIDLVDGRDDAAQTTRLIEGNALFSGVGDIAGQIVRGHRTNGTARRTARVSVLRVIGSAAISQ